MNQSRDEGLKEAIIALMAKVGLKTEGVYQVDAGKRSRHTNAYFTGLGKTKRIVLFDTLIASHTKEEITPSSPTRSATGKGGTSSSSSSSWKRPR